MNTFGRPTIARIAAAALALFACSLIAGDTAGTAGEKAWDDDQQSTIDTILSRVTTAKDQATNASTRGNQIFTRIQDSQQMLQGINLDDAIAEAIEDLKTRIQQSREGRAEFLGNGCDAASPCGGFRADLVALLEGIADVNGALYRVTPASASPDATPLITLVENAPGRLLFPIYRVLGQETPLADSEVAQSLADLAVDLDFLIETLEGPETKAGFPELDQCALLLDNPEVTQRALLGGYGFGILFIAGGHTLIASGETHLEGKAGVHGYPGIILKNNLRKKFGNFFAGVGRSLTTIAGAVSNKRRYCTMLQHQQELLDRQAMILANQEKIWNALPPGWTRDDEILTLEMP